MTTDNNGNNQGRDGRFASRRGKEPKIPSIPVEETTWTTGKELIRSLIDNGDLKPVDPDRDGAQMILDHAENHLVSASKITKTDPQGSIAMSYDAARKAMVAVLIAQGLRAVGKDTHKITAEAIEAQLGRVAHVVRPFHRMRQDRREAEYYNKMTEYLARDAEQTLMDAASIVETMQTFFLQICNRPFAD